MAMIQVHGEHMAVIGAVKEIIGLFVDQLAEYSDDTIVREVLRLARQRERRRE